MTWMMSGDVWGTQKITHHHQFRLKKLATFVRFLESLGSQKVRAKMASALVRRRPKCLSHPGPDGEAWENLR